MLKHTTKEGFHRKFAKVLREVALELDLQEYSVRSCKGGPAGFGEVILHAPSLYVQVCGDACVYQNGATQVLYRSCSSMTDYTGGHNRWMTLGTLTGNREEALRCLRSAMMAAPK